MKPILEKWGEINLDKVEHNVKEIKKNLYKDTLFIAVVKADGYGHGMEEVSQVALENGADWLCVTDPFEGERLRESGFKVPIFILSPPFLDTAEMIVDNDLIQSIDSIEQAQAIDLVAGQRNKMINLHIKVDTGLGRSGVLPEEAGKLAEAVSKMKSIKLQGLYTHFASPYVEIAYSKFQYERFRRSIEEIKKRDIAIDILHCGNSAAIMDLPEFQMDAVRIGFSLCNRHIGLDKAKQWDLEDCFEFKTRIKGIRKIPAGEHIGYDNQFINDKERKIAVLPVGYGDGVPTALGNKGHVLIKGKKLPIIGGVCMSQLFIDLTELKEEISIGDEAVLIGTQNQETLTYKDFGGILGVGDAETIIRISQAVPKLFYKNGHLIKIKK